MEQDQIRKQINENIRKFYSAKKNDFIPGKNKVQYSGPVYNEMEATAFINSFLDGWFGVGKKCYELERKLSSYIGAKEGILTNSGSSANLIAISALCSPQFKKRLKPGDEIITCATSFPTTVNPIIQNSLTPVLVDAEIPFYNASVESIKKALTPKTKGIIIAHMLGNPYEMDVLMEFAEEKNLFIIEDNCDALGTLYANKKTGSFGVMSTYSFYVAHHITMGEGGAILFNSNNDLAPIARSIRDWGRACVCPKCKVVDNPNFQCSLRYDTGDKYDGRYLYTNIGYNLKPLEFQAAFGLEQMKRIPDFLEIRENNFKMINKEFKNFEEYFILPKSLPKAKPAWFSYPLTIKDDANFTREDIIKFFEEKNIETRFLFSGNIAKHPAYRELNLKVSGKLKNSDKIMYNTFFMGIYPGITKEMMEYVLESVNEFMDRYR